MKIETKKKEVKIIKFSELKNGDVFRFSLTNVPCLAVDVPNNKYFWFEENNICIDDLAKDLSCVILNAKLVIEE